MAKFSYDTYDQHVETKLPFNNGNQGPIIRWFKLKDNGDEAIVRFPYQNKSQLSLVTIHSIKDGDRWLKVSCLREGPKDPLSKCPLCESGDNIKSRAFIKVLDFIQDDKGSVLPQPCVWDTSKKVSDIVAGLIDEYGDISQMVFKIKRSGAAGDLHTEYSILPARTDIYKPELYPADFSGFNNLKLEGKFYYDKTEDEMKAYLATGSFLETKAPRKEATQQFVATPVQEPITLNGGLQTAPISVPYQSVTVIDTNPPIYETFTPATEYAQAQVVQPSTTVAQPVFNQQTFTQQQTVQQPRQRYNY